MSNRGTRIGLAFSEGITIACLRAFAVFAADFDLVEGEEAGVGPSLDCAIAKAGKRHNTHPSTIICFDVIEVTLNVGQI
ncbi:MAG: hypothetical protein DMF29_04240 [Verrucomicrobia bacterium]|nr:MAG: hypothetical protein DMF29_04240 [Verrucomicrobiota bacterium]